MKTYFIALNIEEIKYRIKNMLAKMGIRLIYLSGAERLDIRYPDRKV